MLLFFNINCLFSKKNKKRTPLAKMRRASFNYVGSQSNYGAVTPIVSVVSVNLVLSVVAATL